MRRSAVRVGCLVAVLAAIELAGCGDDDDEGGQPDGGAPSADAGVPAPRGTGSAVLTDRARVLDEASLDALTRISRDGSRVELEFSESTPVLDRLVDGDVLIVGSTEHTPDGALLEVQSVSPDGKSLVLQARTAALADAFEELSIDLEGTLAVTDDGPAKDEDGDGVAGSRQALGLSIPFALGDDGDDGIQLSGSVSLESDLGFTLSFDITELALDELSMSFSGAETFQADLTARGTSMIDESESFPAITPPPITILVPIPSPPGTVPVVLTPLVELEVGVVGSARGEASASVLQQASFSASLGYIDGEFEPVSDSKSKFSPAEPTFEGSLNLRAYAGPRMSVMLYGAVGPFANVDAFVELAASGEGPPPCARGVIDAGLSARVGVDFIAEYETTLFDHRETLAQFDSCTDDPNAPKPAPTWARSYGRAGSSGDTAKAVIALEDGSLVVAGDSGLFDGIAGFAAAAWVLRLDPLGNVIWQRAYQRTGLGLVRGLIAVPDGILLAGTSGVIVLDSGGNPRWAKSYAADAPLEFNSLAAQSDGSFVAVGYYGATTQSCVIGFDAQGEVLWATRHVGEELTRLRATRDGAYVAVGLLSPAFDGTLLKLDQDGEVAWARTLDNVFEATPEVPDDPLTTSDDRPFDVAEKPGGGFIVVGEAYGPFPLPSPTPVGYYGSWLFEVDEQGGLTGSGSVVHRAPTDALYGGLYAVAVRENGTSLMVGRRADTAGDLLGNEDVLVIQGASYSALGGPGNDSVDSGSLSGNSRGMPLAITSDGGAILAATSDSFAGQNQFWLAKLNASGSINSPLRTNVAGSAFTNENAASVPLDTNPQPFAVTATDFTDDVAMETTELTSAQQDP